MKNSDYIELLRRLFGKIKAITSKKSHDYAKEENTLSNFYNQAALQNILTLCGKRGSDIAFDFMLTKISRLANLKGTNPACESIEDTVLDLINYTGLYYACLLEESHDKVE